MAIRDSVATTDVSGTGVCAATMPTCVVGDYLSAILDVDRFNYIVTPPAGWVLATDGTNDGNADQGAPDGQTRRVFEKICSGTEGATQTFTTDSTGRTVRVIIVSVSGREASNTIRTIQKTINFASNASPITAAGTGVTAVLGDDILVYFATDPTATSTRTFSTPSGFTARASSTTGSDLNSIACFSQDNVAAGATGNITSTITRTAGTGNSGWAAIVISLKASASAGGNPIAWIRA